MTIARVYYRNNGRTPDFVLVIADTQPIPTQLADVKIVEQKDGNYNTVATALADIGWEPVPGAERIVRQASGVGELTIRPIREPDQVTVRIDNGCLYAVHAGGNTRLLPPGLTWDDATDRQRVIARECVDTVLRDLGYLRLSGLVPLDRHTLTTAVEPGDWHDHPTLVRVNAAAADLLTTAATALGIPADTLASTWIAGAAGTALRSHEWFMQEGRIVDHDRIAGWLPDGSPDLTNTGTRPPGMHGSGGSGV